MKINFWILLILIIFITGCTSQTTGNVVIEDIDDVESAVKEQEKAVEETVEEETENETITIVEEEETNTTNETEQEEEKTATPQIIGKLIKIENLKFVPDELTIKKGETVTWQHNDKYTENMKHMVRIYHIGAVSPVMFYGESFSYTFDKEGEYTVVDVIYVKKNVKGKIFVVE